MGYKCVVSGELGDVTHRLYEGFSLLSKVIKFYGTPVYICNFVYSHKKTYGLPQAKVHENHKYSTALRGEPFMPNSTRTATTKYKVRTGKHWRHYVKCSSHRTKCHENRSIC